MDSSLVPSLVALASKGTELSRIWLLRDLEVRYQLIYFSTQISGTESQNSNPF